MPLIKPKITVDGAPAPTTFELEPYSELDKIDYEATTASKYIAEGSFGKIYVALDLRKVQVTYKGSDIVIKVFSNPDRRSIRTLKKEALINYKLGLSPSKDIKIGDSYAFLTMFQIKGIDLFDFLTPYRTPFFTLEDSLTITIRVLTEVNRIHNLGYLHRDIKHENLMINPKTLEVTLIDYGLAITFPKDRSFIKAGPAGTLGYLRKNCLIKSDDGKDLALYGFFSEHYALAKTLKHLFFRTKVDSLETELLVLLNKMSSEESTSRYETSYYICWLAAIIATSPSKKLSRKIRTWAENLLVKYPHLNHLDDNTFSRLLKQARNTLVNPPKDLSLYARYASALTFTRTAIISKKCYQKNISAIINILYIFRSGELVLSEELTKQAIKACLDNIIHPLYTFLLLLFILAENKDISRYESNLSKFKEKLRTALSIEDEDIQHLLAKATLIMKTEKHITDFLEMLSQVYPISGDFMMKIMHHIIILNMQSKSAHQYASKYFQHKFGVDDYLSSFYLLESPKSISFGDLEEIKLFAVNFFKSTTPDHFLYKTFVSALYEINSMLDDISWIDKILQEMPPKKTIDESKSQQALTTAGHFSSTASKYLEDDHFSMLELLEELEEISLTELRTIKSFTDGFLSSPRPDEFLYKTLASALTKINSMLGDVSWVSEILQEISPRILPTKRGSM